MTLLNLYPHPDTSHHPHPHFLPHSHLHSHTHLTLIQKNSFNLSLTPFLAATLVLALTFTLSLIVCGKRLGAVTAHLDDEAGHLADHRDYALLRRLPDVQGALKEDDHTLLPDGAAALQARPLRYTLPPLPARSSLPISILPILLLAQILACDPSSPFSTQPALSSESLEKTRKTSSFSERSETCAPLVSRQVPHLFSPSISYLEQILSPSPPFQLPPHLLPTPPLPLPPLQESPQVRLSRYAAL